MKNNKSILLIIATILISVYVAIASLNNSFQLKHFDYLPNWKYNMLWFSNEEIHSQVWKTILLLPAIVTLSYLLSYSSFTASLHRYIHKIKFHLTKKTTLYLLILSIVSLVVLFFSVEMVFNSTFVTDDENSYVFQAKTLLEGRLVNPSPKELKPNNWFIINDGINWTGRYSHGHPLFIALGIVIGHEHFFIFLISVLLIPLIYLLAKELYHDSKITILSPLLLFISPFFYSMSSSLLSHTTSCFILYLSFLLFLKTEKTENKIVKFIFYVFIGFLWGFSLNIRQVTALAIITPMFFIILRNIWKNPSRIFEISVPLVLGAIPTIFFALHYNYVVTGSPFVFPFQYYDANEFYGFGSQGHTFLRGLSNIGVTLFRLNIWLFGFPMSLVFVFLIMFSHLNRSDKLLLSIISCMFFFYFFYYSPGVSDLGPIYYYEILIPLILLSSRGILFVVNKLKEQYHTIIFYYLLLSFLASISTFYPERISHIKKLTNKIREPYETINKASIHNAIIFVKNIKRQGWVFSIKNPSPNLDDDVLYFRYTDSLSNRKHLEYFPNRKAYILDYDSKQEKYNVVPFNE